MTPDHGPCGPAVVVGKRLIIVHQEQGAAQTPPDSSLDPLEKPYHDSGDGWKADEVKQTAEPTTPPPAAPPEKRTTKQPTLPLKYLS